MKIFKTIKSSVWSPAFYGEVEKKSLKEVFGYYAKLSLLLGLCLAIASIFLVFPAISSVKDFHDKALASYPAGLEISVIKGIATTNSSSSPLIIPFKSLSFSADNANAYENLLVIDTRATSTPTIESFKSQKTFALLSDKYLVAFDKDNSVIFYDLSKFPDFVMNQGVLQKFLGLLDYLPFFLPLLFFIMGFFLSFFSLVAVIISSLFFMLIERIVRHKISFSSAFKICAYASTFPLILNAILFFAGIPIPLIFSLLTLIIALANINAGQKEG